MKSELKQLIGLPGVSGTEGPVLDWLQEKLESVGEVCRDAMGNLLVHRKGSGKKLMLTTPVDLPGLMVTQLEDGGTARVGTLGPLEPWMYVGRTVTMSEGSQAVVRSHGSGSNCRAEDLYLDLSDGPVAIGETASFSPAWHETAESIGASYLSARGGCAILLRLLQNLKAGSWDLYVVFTVQGQLGNRGIGPASYGVQPDMAIAVEGCKEEGAIQSGKGPVVALLDRRAIYSKSVTDKIRQAAAAKNLTIQLSAGQREAVGGGGSLPIGGGIPTGSLRFAVKDWHSPLEVASIRDMEACTTLLQAILEERYDTELD